MEGLCAAAIGTFLSLMPAPEAPTTTADAFESSTSDGQAHPARFYAGGAIGRGSVGVSCDGCPDRPSLDDALSVSAFAGVRITPRLGVFGEYWLTTWRDRSGPYFGDSQIHRVSQHAVTAGAQLWVTERLWLRAQLGVGRHEADYDYRDTPGLAPVAGETSSKAEPDSSYAPATAIGAGFEWARNRDFAATIELRAARTRADARTREITTGSISLGASFF